MISPWRVGTAELSPLQVAVGYSTFANGGFRVTPYYIDRIEDAAGKTLFRPSPPVACFECGRGATGPPPRRRAKAGATGTGSRNRDAGAQRRQVADSREGSRAADHPPANRLPVVRHDGGRDPPRHRRRRARCSTATTSPARRAPPTIFTMPGSPASTAIWWPPCGPASIRTARWATASKGARARCPPGYISCTRRSPERRGTCVPMPDGIVTVRISPDTGLLASADNPNGIMEKFIEGNLPKSEVYEGPNNHESDERRRQAAFLVRQHAHAKEVFAACRGFAPRAGSGSRAHHGRARHRGFPAGQAQGRRSAGRERRRGAAQERRDRSGACARTSACSAAIRTITR